MKIFDRKPTKGVAISHPMFLTAWLRMARAWEMLSVAGGRVSWHNGIPTIILDGDAGGEAGAVPEGDADNPHLIWDDTAKEWVKGVIVPEGDADNRHLVWDDTKKEWVKGVIVPEGANSGDMLKWDGTNNKWIVLSIPKTVTHYLMAHNRTLTWVEGQAFTCPE